MDWSHQWRKLVVGLIPQCCKWLTKLRAARVRAQRPIRNRSPWWTSVISGALAPWRQRLNLYLICSIWLSLLRDLSVKTRIKRQVQWAASPDLHNSQLDHTLPIVFATPTFWRVASRGTSGLASYLNLSTTSRSIMTFVALHWRICLRNNRVVEEVNWQPCYGESAHLMRSESCEKTDGPKRARALRHFSLQRTISVMARRHPLNQSSDSLKLDCTSWISRGS